MRSVIIRLPRQSMDAAQPLRRIVFFVAAAMLVAANGHAADLIAGTTTVVITGSVQSQTVHVTSSDNTVAVPFSVSVTEQDDPTIQWLGTNPATGTTPADVA